MYELSEDYLRFYRKFLINQWNDVGPREYVIMLVTVGVIGYILMRKAARL